MKLGCVIMAAGESRRFGENKLLRTLDGIPLYTRALSTVPEGVFEAVCVVTGYEPIAVLAAEMGFAVVRNDRPELGISRTIRLGLEPLTDCDGVLFMTSDQPLLTGETLHRLANAFLKDPSRIYSAAHNGKRGNPCLFPRSLFPDLLSLHGDTGGSRIIRENADRLCLLEVPERELIDCDTAQALRILEQAKK